MTKEELRITIGNNIRNERHIRGITIDELAKLLGLSSSALGLVERGDRGTTTYNLLKLSKIFDTSIDNFFIESSIKPVTETSQLNKKINSLITGFTEKELEFVVDAVKWVGSVSQS